VSAHRHPGNSLAGHDINELNSAIADNEAVRRTSRTAAFTVKATAELLPASLK
jgi:hypothetical protein